MSRLRNALSVGCLAASFVLIGTGLSRMQAQAETPAPEKKPTIDLAFCIDTTGSMSNEIESVKSKTKEIVAKLAGTKPTPNIRVGVVAFRDRGDEYVTRVFPFTEDIDQIVKDIQGLRAVGGGDEPEAVSEALHAAVNELHWSKEKKAVKVVFLIGDAGPKDNGMDWKAESKNAIAQGIQVNTIACDGLHGSGAEVFQQIAKLTDGQSELLTYRQQVVRADGKAETIVSAGGRSFEVEGDSDAWKEGAASLAARGKARAVTNSASAWAPSMKASRSLSGAGSFASRRELSIMDERPTVTDYRAPSMAGVTLDSMALPSASYGRSVSRADSNLADIVVTSTLKTLKKKSSE